MDSARQTEMLLKELEEGLKYLHMPGMRACIGGVQVRLQQVQQFWKDPELITV